MTWSLEDENSCEITIFIAASIAALVPNMLCMLASTKITIMYMVMIEAVYNVHV